MIGCSGAETGTNAIWRADLSCSSATVEAVLTNGVSEPYGIDFVPETETLYWVDAGSTRIMRISLDDSMVEEVATIGFAPRAIAVDFPTFLDCNNNCTPDFNDIAAGSSEDCNTNGIPDECDTGNDWIEWPRSAGGNGHRYKSTDTVNSRSDAEAEAILAGGHLVTINDAFENAWVFDKFAQDGNVWIGLFQDLDAPDYSEPDGGWIWPTGEIVWYTNWIAGEPNDNGDEQWAEMKGALSAWPGQWNDQGVNTPAMRGVIELDVSDCNNNSIPDECELVGNDCNTNGIPDECEADFDGDGQTDDCDPDIDDDGVPNELDACNYTPLGAPIIDDAESCLYGTLRGDYDGDCDVDLNDFALFEKDITGPN
jgi:hypothetical protein